MRIWTVLPDEEGSHRRKPDYSDSFTLATGTYTWHSDGTATAVWRDRAGNVVSEEHHSPPIRQPPILVVAEGDPAPPGAFRSVGAADGDAAYTLHVPTGEEEPDEHDQE